MCDTLYLRRGGLAVFGKNSDRPCGEPQIIESHPRRPAGGLLRTQYLEISDAGAAAVLLSRPTWLWGAEHGVNEHGVAIGNEKVYTVVDAYELPAALTGMDLVRLGLERGRTASDALDVMTSLLERHGQGGVCDLSSREPYCSSFLVADATQAHVLETAGRSWAARTVTDAVAISNRLSLGTSWTSASTDVSEGIDFDRYRNQDAPTGYADVRLEASAAFLGSWARSAGDAPDPAALVAHLRDHGGTRWGRPGDSQPVVPPPIEVSPEGKGITICMHVRGYQATTASMVVELRDPTLDAGGPVRAYVALGSPCVSVYVPVVVRTPLPPELGDERTWQLVAGLRDRVEADGTRLGQIRSVLDPLETDLWLEASSLDADDPVANTAWEASAGRRVLATLERLAV